MVTALQARLPLLLAALWWGSLTAVGGVVVPVVWAHVPLPAQASSLAAAVLAGQAWISIACCALLLVFSKRKYEEKQEPWAQVALIFVLGGLLLALVGQYGVAPRILAKQGAVWGYAGVFLYGLQWVSALCTLWQVALRWGAAPQAAGNPASVAGAD